jgi:hypothetical protein
MHDCNIGACVINKNITMATNPNPQAISAISFRFMSKEITNQTLT